VLPTLGVIDHAAQQLKLWGIHSLRFDVQPAMIVYQFVDQVLSV
jgi:hypothetical protein